MKTFKKLTLIIVIASCTNSLFAQIPIFTHTNIGSTIADENDKNGNRKYHAKDNLNSPADTNSFNIFKDLHNVALFNKFLYNQNNESLFSSFQSLSIQNFNGVHTDVNAELASFLFGPVRLSVSGLFQTKGDTTKDNAIKSSAQKIISNGGTINLNFLVPLFINRSGNGQVNFGVFGQFNNAVNPGIDSTGTTDYSNNLSYTNQTGLLFHFDVGSNDNTGKLDNKARLSLDLPCFYSISSNNVNNLVGLPNFFMVRLQAGAVLGDVLSFHIAGPVISTSSKVQHSPFLVSLQFSPSQLVKSSPK